MDRKVQRPLTKAEMAEIMALVDGMVVESDYDKPLIKVFDLLLHDIGQTWDSMETVKPSDYAIPLAQAHEIIQAIGDKIVSISGLQEDMVTWNLTWMNKGPSYYEPDNPGGDASMNAAQLTPGEYVDQFDGDATAAMLSIARQFGIAVAYLDRSVFEGHVGRPLTDDEWSRIGAETEDYDEAVCDALDLNSDFINEVLGNAGFVLDDDSGEWHLNVGDDSDADAQDDGPSIMEESDDE